MIKNRALYIRFGITFTAIIFAGAITTSAFTFSWFSNKNNITKDFSGETAGAYFGGGDGTSSNPYIISRPIHLYNLSWLQYIGYFNNDSDNDSVIDKQFYFKVSKDITMPDDYVLPPIGTEENPFIGNFDGADHLITNLKISTKIGNDNGNIGKYPGNINEDDFNNKDINIVGFFGIIGTTTTGADASSYSYTDEEGKSHTYSYTSSVNEVKNIYLDDVTINAYASETLCGILAGYVNGPLTNSGVHYGSLKLASGVSNISKYTNVSNYTLIGDYNADKFSWDNGKGSGGDIGYGTSADIYALHTFLTADSTGESASGLIDKPTPSSEKVGEAMPFRFSSNEMSADSYQAKTMTVKDLSTSNMKTLDIPNSNALPADSNGDNIGYYVGEMKTYDVSSKKIEFSADTVAAHNVSAIKTVDDSIIEHLNEKVGSSTKRNGDFMVRFTASNDFTELGSDASRLTYIKDAWVGKWHSTENVGKTGNLNGCLLLPIDCMWVAPVQTGRFDFVVTNVEGKDMTMGLIVVKLHRQVPGDYSTYFDSAEAITRYIGYQSASKGKSFYIGVEVTDLNYEYAVLAPNSTGTYASYIDIGTNGGGDGDRKLSWSFDFVEKDSSGIIKINDSSFKATNLMFEIKGGGSSAYSYYFRRTSGNANPTVLYYATSDFTLITPNGSSSYASKASDSSCENEDTTSA